MTSPLKVLSLAATTLTAIALFVPHDTPATKPFYSVTIDHSQDWQTKNFRAIKPDQVAPYIEPIGLQLIKKHEGFSAVAYKCPAGKWTLGYGETGPHIKEGMTITKAQAEKRVERLYWRYRARVVQLVPNATHGQTEALTSLLYNIGETQFTGSTLHMAMMSGNIKKAESEFKRWVYAKGSKLGGLVTRRGDELQVFKMG